MDPALNSSVDGGCHGQLHLFEGLMKWESTAEKLPMVLTEHADSAKLTYGQAESYDKDSRMMTEL